MGDIWTGFGVLYTIYVRYSLNWRCDAIDLEYFLRANLIAMEIFVGAAAGPYIMSLLDNLMDAIKYYGRDRDCGKES